MQVLVVVDMQNDFINGVLGTSGAEKIVPKVAEKIQSFSGRVLYTRDTHNADYLKTQEGQMLPVPHCIHGTEGWFLHPDIEALRKETPIDKPTFASLALGQVLKAADIYDEKIESVTLIGLCTDICIISNALMLKAFLPETRIIVDAGCCAGVTPDSHQTALKAMEMCQIIIENNIQ